MKNCTLWLGAIIASAVFSWACPEIDGGGGGGGGTTFTEGFVFVRADNQNIYVADKADFQSVRQLTTSGNNRQPSLSPDGRLVVFVHTDGSASSIQTVSSSGGAVGTLISSDATRSRFASPVFSPDGARIAFTFERGGSSLLGIMNADGSSVEELSSGTLSYASPTFYPDGQSLLVAAGNLSSGFTQIEKFDIAAGSGTNLLNGLGNEALSIQNRLVISPDGASAAFDGVVASNTTRIFVVDLAVRTVSQVTDPGDASANDSYPCWIDSTELAFSSDTGGNDQVYVIAAGASKTTGTLRLPSAIQPWYGP